MAQKAALRAELTPLQQVQCVVTAAQAPAPSTSVAVETTTSARLGFGRHVFQLLDAQCRCHDDTLNPPLTLPDSWRPTRNPETLTVARGRGLLRGRLQRRHGRRHEARGRCGRCARGAHWSRGRRWPSVAMGVKRGGRGVGKRGWNAFF